MHAYAVQPSAGLVKLDAMENPFRCRPNCSARSASGWARVAINRYPAAAHRRPDGRAGRHAGLPAGCKR
jgi:histidinol-phosphate aminotransferase